MAGGRNTVTQAMGSSWSAPGGPGDPRTSCLYQIGLPLLCTGERKEAPFALERDSFAMVPGLPSPDCCRAARVTFPVLIPTIISAGQMPAPVRQGYVVSNQQPRRRQKRVLRLEAKRAAATIGYAILALIAVAVSVSATLYHANAGQIPSPIPASVTTIVAIAAAALALMLLIEAVVNGNRWHLARAVERLSNDPYLARSMPEGSPPEFLPQAHLIPPLEVELVKPRRLPGPRPLRRVTAAANVAGRRPLSIAYLRLFENEARTRTFIQGAWREFGYVHFLRSAASVTPAEFRHAKSTGNLRGIFLISREQFLAELAKAPPVPSTRHRQVFRNIAPRTIKVWDRYGSYLPMGHLCHGTIWKPAIDELLRYVDLVVLDLSGFTTRNLGTEYELQRVIDLFPIERVIFLADAYSDRGFLRSQILAAWQKMAAGSPNSGAQPRTACLAVTDHYRRPQRAPVVIGPRGQGQVVVQQGPERLRLEASRRESRRLAAAVQKRVLQAQPGRGPRPESLAAPGTAPMPAIHRPDELWWTKTQPPGPEPDPSSSRSTTPIIRSTPTPAAASPARPPAIASGVQASRWRLAGKLAALAGSVMYLASVALFSNYTNQAPGGPVSLYRAAHHDYWSPLHDQNFWTVITLLALISALTIISFTVADRPLMAGATLTALGLAGYTLYIPMIGSAGFSAYGSSYWASLVAAVVMALGAGLAAVMA